MIPAMTGFVTDAKAKSYITEGRTAYIAAQIHYRRTIAASIRLSETKWHQE